MKNESDAECHGPISGVSVLDLSTVIAGPFAAALLGDLGAEVLKVELPLDAQGRGGDGLRQLPPHKDGKPLIWKSTNRNKKAITLDLRREEGRELLLRLVSRFDVVVENFRPGTLDKWGITKEALWNANRSLTILRVTGFGQTGPYRSYPGFARLFEAYSGLVGVTGDETPLHAGYPIGDPISGTFGALGVVAALLRRAKHPEESGQEIDLSCTEAVMRLLEVLPVEYDQLGFNRKRIGNDNAYSSPSGVFQTADGKWITLSAGTQSVFERLCELMGMEDLRLDDHFKDNSSRVANRVQLNAIVNLWISQQPSHSLVQRLSEYGVSAAPIFSSQDIAEDPHFKVRGAIERIPDDDFGSVAVPCIVPRFSSTPGRLRCAGPSLGAHNAEVYGKWLGLTPEEQKMLAQKRII